MPRLQEATKDAGGCDKPRGAVNQAMIRGFLNGETHAGEGRRILFGGSEPGEVKHLSTLRKIKQSVIPLVVASERGLAQTDGRKLPLGLRGAIGASRGTREWS